MTDNFRHVMTTRLYEAMPRTNRLVTHPLSDRKVGPRRPVEHGPTKAPFSRAARRARNRAAHHSMMRNVRR